MCGIAGIYSADVSAERAGEASALVPLVEAMTTVLTPRGPDACGYLADAGVMLGHRRLSILELSDAGAQPMKIVGHGVMVTYNGEVYNFRELRRQLKSLGSEFRGQSDTEVVLHAYVQWGLEGLKRLEGIFALALWDPTQRRLVLMRDRLGVKPLYYGESRHGLAFGSEIKAVLAAGGVDTDLDDQSLSEYLWYGNSHGDRTFYKGVRALEAGQWLVIENGQRRLESWWSVEDWLQETPQHPSQAEAEELVRDALDQAVARQLVADVPVGIFLSGGVDSSSIAAAAMQQSEQPLASYAAGFDFDRGINELAKAQRVAKHLGLSHHELQVSGAELESVLIDLAQAHDDPFADAANIPLYLMCKQLAGAIKVVLQGDGGDELFAGYRRYAILRNSAWWRLWPTGLSSIVRAGGHFGRRLARMADAAGHPDPALRMAFLLTTETPIDPPEAVFLRERGQHLTETTDPFIPYRKAAERFKDYEPVQQMLLTDLTVQLPSQFLTKVDRATMAAGIEARVPLLDEKVVRLALNLPSTFKVRGAEKKIILRNSQRARLPADILDGPKTGFGVPYEHWLRTSLYSFAEERILDSGFLRHFSLDGERIRKMLSQHKNEQMDRGFMLWKLLQLSFLRVT